VTKDRLELEKFKDIGSEDLDIIENYLKKYKYETCDYNIVNLFSWGHFLNVRWRMYKDRLLFFNFTSGLMLYPLGDPFSVSEITALSDMIINDGYSGNFVSVHEKYIQDNPSISDHFLPAYDEGNSDYIYLSEHLALLPGKKLHKKKNLVSQFKRNYTYEIETFNKKHIELCAALSIKWCRETSEMCDDERKLELNVLHRAMTCSDIIDLKGILILTSGKLAAFSLYSELNENTADIHFEKYDPDIKGSGQIINQETASYLKERYKFINREQDMGKEGLRKAKLSYEPERIIPTYRFVRK
jgi:uncharacterized protein